MSEKEKEEKEEKIYDVTQYRAAASISCHPIILAYPDLEKKGDLGNQLFQIASIIALTLVRQGVFRSQFGPKEWKFGFCFDHYERWYHSLTNSGSGHVQDWADYSAPHADVLHAWKTYPSEDTQPKKILRHNFYGYFQRANLLEAASPRFRTHILKKVFAPSPMLAVSIAMLWKTIMARTKTSTSSRLCAVHIRRGDYCTVRDGKSICLSWAYYESAMGKSKEIWGKDIEFVFFTDDYAFVRRHAPQSIIIGAGMTDETRHLPSGGEAVAHLLLMSKCPYKIIANSTYSWWAAFLSDEEHKTQVIAPSIFFPHQMGSEGLICSFWTTMPSQWENPELSALQMLYNKTKRVGIKKKQQIFSCGYCFPTSRILPIDAAVHQKKCTILADLIPGIRQTYRFSVNQEEDYLRMYREARFALTKKKGGWDALRHYEILSQGCIPIFEDLVACPAETMTEFPKDILHRSEADLLPWKGTDDQTAKYQATVKSLLIWMHERLSTRAHGDRICAALGLKSADRVLLLMGDMGINYLREMTIIGLHEVLGNRFYEFPKHQVLYSSFPESELKDQYGFGFGYARELRDDYDISNKIKKKEEIIDNINNGVYEWILYGKVGPFDGVQGSLPNLDLWKEAVHHRVEKHRQKVAFFYGGDTAMHTEHRHVREHLLYGPCFIRELCKNQQG